MGRASSEGSDAKAKEKRREREPLKDKKDRKETEKEKKEKQRKEKEREKEKGKDKPKARPKGDAPEGNSQAKDTKVRKEEDSDDDIEKEKEKDKLAFLAAIKGLREKDKKVEKKKTQPESRKKPKRSSSPGDRKERREKRRVRERSRSKDDESSGSESPEKPKKETALVTSSGFGAPPSLVTSIVPAAVGASDVIGVFCRSAGADQNSEQALRALPAHLQQAVMAEGSIAGLNPSAVLMGRIRKVENNAGAANAAAAGLHRPRPETVAAAAAGDPVAKFCMQHAVDYSAENALRALPVELQCRILNEGPLRASNPSAVLMSRIRKAQTLLAEMRRLGKVPV